MKKATTPIHGAAASVNPANAERQNDSANIQQFFDFCKDKANFLGGFRNSKIRTKVRALVVVKLCIFRNEISSDKTPLMEASILYDGTIEDVHFDATKEKAFCLQMGRCDRVVTWRSTRTNASENYMDEITTESIPLAHVSSITYIS